MEQGDKEFFEDMEIAFFIDDVLATAYPNGIRGKRDKKVKRLREWIAEDDTLPEFDIAVMFAKDIS